MQITQEELDFIDRYFASELTSEEEILLEIKLKEDENFKEAFDFMQLLEKSIQISDRNEKLELLKNYELKNYSPSESTIPPSTSKLYNLKRWIIPFSGIAVASIILIIGFSTLFNTPSKTDKIFNNYFEAPPSHVLKRSIKQDLSIIKQKAYALYGIDEFESAGPLLVELCNNGDQQSCLFAAISFITTKDHQKAQLLFDQHNFLPKTDPNIIKWYQGLLYIKQEKLNKAIILFKELANSEHHFTEDSKKILLELNTKE